MAQTDHDRRIDYIEFPVTDVASAKAFYAAAFGWTFEDFGPDYASFNDGRISGGFRQEAKVQPGGPLIILYSARLSEARTSVINSGGKIVGDLHRFPGGCRFYFTDPAGHQLAVWSETDA